MGVSESLAEWTIGLRPEDVPAQVRGRVSACLVDAFGTALAANRLGVAKPELDVAKGLAGSPEATIIGTDEQVSSFSAALANGTLVHALDFDDTHPVGLVHASAIVLPTAFAVGEECGSSGAEVFAAAVAGYELICRLGAAAPQNFHDRGAHATSVCGVIAAALVAAKLSGLNQLQTESAIGIAASQASGLMEFSRTGGSVKRFHPGWAAGSGIISARLAASGLKGPTEALEGEFGLYTVFADRKPDLSELLQDLGSVWRLNEITLKLYPSCQLMHGSLDAARQLRSVTNNVHDLRRVVATVPVTTASIVCEPRAAKLKPTSPYDAKFSLPWSVAAMLIDGVVNLSTYAPDQLDRTDITELADRISHKIVPFNCPDAKAPGWLRAHMNNGREVEVHLEQPNDESSNRLAVNILRDKLRTNAGGTTLADSLTQAIENLEGASNVRSIMQLVSSKQGAAIG